MALNPITQEDVKEIQRFFDSVKKPDALIIDKVTTYTNLSESISSGLALLKGNPINSIMTQALYQGLISIKAALIEQG